MAIETTDADVGLEPQTGPTLPYLVEPPPETILVASPIAGKRYGNSLQALRKTSQYEVLFPRFLHDFRLAAQLRRIESGEIDPEELDLALSTLRQMLQESHPVMPLLTGKVVLKEPAKERPLIFKLYQPKLKELNTLYGESGADELMGQVQDAVEAFFASEKGGLPILTLVQRDAKASKAIIHFNSPEFDGLDAEQAKALVHRKVIGVQSVLTQLVLEFDRSHGKKLPTNFRAKMVFGEVDAWDLVEDPENLTTKDYVMQFIAAELVSNVAQVRRESDRRSSDRPEGRRRDYVSLSARQFAAALERDLRQVVPPFKALYDLHKEDPQWKPLFRYVRGAPFLSKEALQRLREKKLQTQFSFLSEEEVTCFTRLVEVINTVDVLKPFLSEDIDLLVARLESNASLLQEEPQEEAEKVEYVQRLAQEVRVSLKDRARHGDPILHTRFALSEQLYEVLCTDQDSKESGDELPKGPTLLLGDGKAFGATNLQGLFADAFTLFESLSQDGGDVYDYIMDVVARHSTEEIDALVPELAPALKHLISSTGDRGTRQLRTFVEALLECDPSGKALADASGGDELRVLVSSEADIGPLLRLNRIRMVAIQLASVPKLSVLEAADLLACIFVFAEGLTKALKVAEHKNKTISKEAVHVTIRK